MALIRKTIRSKNERWGPMLQIKTITKFIWGGVALVILGIIGFSSWYTVDESEQAVIATFGSVDEGVVDPGLHFKMPWPIQQVQKLSKETFSLQFGYKEGDGQVEEYPKDTKMVTGDENIVLADLVVQWKITEPEKYLYNSEDPKQILYNATSASLRSIVGSSKIDDALTSGKAKIETDVRGLLTELMKKYNVGISVVNVKLQDVELPNKEVRKAFTNVTDARETMNTKINEANKYRNKRTKEAEGERDALISAAKGDEVSRIETAKGDVAVFNSIYEEYKKSPDITKKRLILETIEKVFPKADIYIMKDDGNTMKYLPIAPIDKAAKSDATPKVDQNQTDEGKAEGSDGNE